MKHWVLALTLLTSTVYAAKPAVTSAPFGKLQDGTPITLYSLVSGSGVEVRAMTYGGIITSIKAPDRNGDVADIVLGHDALAGYFDNSPHFGAIIGRYANRIANAQFVLQGKTYHLAANDGPNSLHGGVKGFDRHIWQATPFERADAVGVTFKTISADGEEGFPGKLELAVTYTLNTHNELKIEYAATTDRTTVVNFTQHSYFNLAGEDAGSILDHEVTINASQYTPVDATLIPTGKLAEVTGTPFDFREPRRLGERIALKDPQLDLGKGYDHNFVLKHRGDEIIMAARVREPGSGRLLEVWTTEPGMQFYTGNMLNGSVGKHGRAYRSRAGLCLETQHWPDSPNHPSFPSTTLRPGERFRSTTIYRFGTF
jgi:aldose 1-epimerase